MKKTLLAISIALTATNISANEMNTQGWNFPTPDQTVVAQNRAMLFCDANPKKCPDALFFSRRGGSGSSSGGAGGGDSLVHPATSSTANSMTVVLSGDNSTLNLNNDQASDGNTLNTDAEVNPTIDYDEVLNITNNNNKNK